MRPLAALAVLPALWILGAPAGPAAAQFPPDSLTNLRVLPPDITTDSLIRIMAGFTRALGVRCSHCHMGEEGQPLSTFEFAADDKLAKRKARAMIEMVGRINDQHLASLEERFEPAVRVECATCHRGTTEPRMLQDILLAAFGAGGADSAITAYRSLRGRYYGRFTYDFSEVPLADVATRIAEGGRFGDAERMNALNVEMNPGSAFAGRQHAATAVAAAFVGTDASAARARHAEIQALYGNVVAREGFLNEVGYFLLQQNRTRAAVAAFRLNVELYPGSANVYDSLGEGLAAHGEVAAAIENYERSLRLDPQNANAIEKLRELRRRRPAR